VTVSNAQVALLAASGTLHTSGTIGQSNSTPNSEHVLRRADGYLEWLNAKDGEREISDQTLIP
jgi:hypothetical protein